MSSKTLLQSTYKLQSMTQSALCIAALIVSSYMVISVPFTPITFSLHTVFINIIGLIMTPWSAVKTVIIYLVMGVIGLPVFAAGTSGPIKLFGPTGGFYFGFLAAVAFISLLKGKKRGLIKYVLITVFVGLPIQHFFAVLFMCLSNGFDVNSAIITVSLPFILTDIIKCFAASLISVKLNLIYGDKYGTL